MTTIVKRATKGSPLTHAEMDANFDNLNTYKVERDAAGNVGIGVTPKAWGATCRAIQIGNGMVLSGSSASLYAEIGANYYTDGANNRYIDNGAAGTYAISGNDHSWYVAPSGSNGDVLYWTQAMTLDGGGNLLMKGGGGLGYGEGSGGTITQATSRTTAVTLNKPTGAITLFSTSTSAGQIDTFTLNNSSIGANDVVVFSQKSGTAVYIVTAYNVGAGFCTVSVFTPAAASAEAPVINFSVIKGATS